MSHRPIFRPVTLEIVDEAIERARRQEAIYGHNTGHFTLDREKENTVIGTIGEVVAREVLLDLLAGRLPGIQLSLSGLGSEVDLDLRGPGHVDGIHVKTGLWKSWPSPTFAFGVHADQGIQDGHNPLVLVSLKKPAEGFPTEARIEGFVEPAYLRTCDLIRKGDRFPVTGVLSRTDNILTYIRDYQALDELNVL